MHFEPTSLLHLPISLCGAAVFAVFFARFLGTRYRSKLLYAIIYSAYFLANASLSILMPEIVSYLTIVICFCFPLVLYNGSIIQRIICGGLLTAYSFVTECLTMVASSYIIGQSAAELRLNTVAYYIGAYASAVFLLLLAIMVTKKRSARLSTSPNKYYLALLLVVWICAGLSFGDMAIVEQSGASANLIHLLSEVAITALSVLFFFIFENFQIQADQKEHTALVERQLLQEEQRFKLIDTQLHEVKSIKHDITNHMTTIYTLLAKAQYDEATEYLNEYFIQTATILSRSITGKSSVDVLISEKISQAEKSGILFDIKADKLAEVNISTYHLNIILSNALDNAIEACLKISEITNRYISLGLKTEGDNLCIRVVNTSPPVDILADGLPATNKADRLQHGLGLSTITRVAEQYRGTILCAYSEGEFTLYVQVMNSSLDS